VDSRVELTVWGVSSDRTIRDHVQCAGPDLAAVALRNGSPDKASVLIKAQARAEGTQSVSCDGATAELPCSHTVSVVPTTVVVGRLTPEAKPTLIGQGSSETLVAFRLSDDGTTTERAWLSRGRVQSPRAQDAVMDGGVLLADLTGDGNLETIAATACPESGCARLVALDADGVLVWHRDFARFPGPMPTWNVGGLTYYFAGRFTSPNHCDVLVSLRRGSMHSDESYLLNGQTGDVVWHRDVGPCELGCGGGWMAIYDHDGDGLDDAISLYPHAIWAMDGQSGELLVGKMAQEVFGCSAFHAKPVVFRIDGDARYVLFSGTAYVLGLLDQDLNLVWQGPPMGGSPAVMQSIGDMDGDGGLEIAGPGYCRENGLTAQDFCCHDAATGALKWRVALPGSCFVGNNAGFDDSPKTPAMADLDGDGRDECVFAIEDTLYAVGATADGGGEICWTLKLPGRLGPPSVADVAGEEELQVVVSCADGHIYGIGPKSA
jgi:outer membrane protein assembly factor BamB